MIRNAFLRARGERGAVLVGAILLLLVLAIMVPSLVFLVKQDMKSAIKQKRSTVAFYAAEAGIDRAKWHLTVTTATFDNIVQTGVIPDGYKGEVTYTDVDGGAYIVSMTTTDTRGEILVECTGRDNSEDQFRTIQVILMKETVTAAVYAAGLGVGSSSKVFWGPLMSTADLDLKSSANQHYPRKFARGAISAPAGLSDGYGIRDEDGVASTDGLEWWSYNMDPGVPDAPSVDLAYYKEIAEGQACGTNPGDEGHQPAEALLCYYDDNPQNRSINSLNDTDETKVRYFERNVGYSSTIHFRGVLIVMGNLDMSTSGADEGQYTVTPPENAWKEYQKNTPAVGDKCDDTYAGLCDGGGEGAKYQGPGTLDDNVEGEEDDGCCHQYPGDAGDHAVEEFTFKTGTCPHSSGGLGGAPGEAVTFKGFIYVNGNAHLTSSVVIHGAVQMGPSGEYDGTSSAAIFFDETLDIKMTNDSFSQSSWKELPAKTF